MPEIEGYTEASAPDPDRRVHERRRVPLAYIDLGESNGGIVLNISEGGLAVTAVEALQESHLPRMRFQLPHTHTRIEAAGQIIWTGESRREAGVRFVDLAPGAAEQIREWMGADTASSAPPAPVPRKVIQAEITAPRAASKEAGPSNVRRPFTAMMTPEPPVPEPAVAEPIVAETPSAIIGSHPDASAFHPVVPPPAAAPESVAISAPQIPEADSPAAATKPEISIRIPELPPPVPMPTPAQEHAEPALPVEALMPGRSFSAALQRTKLPVAPAPPHHSKLLPQEETSIFQHVPAPADRLDYGIPQRRWWALTVLISLFSVISFVAGMAAGGGGWDGVLRLFSGRTTLAGEPEKPVEAATNATANSAASSKPPTGSPGGGSVAARQPDAKSAAHPFSADRAAAGPSARVHENESASIELNLPETTVTASGSVAITSQRSVQLTPESAPKASLQGGSVQIGQLFYRLEPFYPAAAEKHGIEGTVEVQATVGRDGRVRTAEAVSGPGVLSEAAVNAVREWRYKPTLVNGRPVESAVTVKMIFRLPRDKSATQ